MTPYSIRAARPKDILALPDIERAAVELLRGHAPDLVLNELTSEEEFREAAGAGLLWVALAADTPVGFALVSVLSPNQAHLQEVDVLPSHGRRGLGAALVRAVCEWARRKRYGGLTLTTFRTVPWNMPFYSRLGFEEIGSDDLTPKLVDIVHDEASRGFDPSSRVVMRRQLDAAVGDISCVAPTGAAMRT